MTSPSDPIAQHLLAKKPRSGVAGFFDGIAVPWEGYLYLRAHRRLWRYALVPILLHFCLSLALLAGAVTLAVSAYGWLGAVFPTGWGWTILKVIAEIGIVIAFLAGGVGLALGLAVLLCSVFYARLAREIELRLGTPESELAGQSPLKDILEAAANLVEILVVNVACILLSLVPIAGGAIAPFASFWLNSFLFGREAIDFAQSARGIPRADKRALARRHRAPVMGLGTVVLLFNIIPVLGSLCLAPAVAGGVFLYHRVRNAER